jgi:hypothetical protein
MDPTVVDDPEDLYRSIRSKSDEYAIVSGATLFSVNAFRDVSRKPSVDRSAIRTNPVDAKKSASDGVAKVVAREVRSVCSIVINPDKKGGGTKKYAVDVLHRPIINVPNEPNNPAHCQIECDPTLENGGRFRKLQEALARIATRHGFVVAPS